MLANPASIYNLALHFKCYLHGGQGKERNRIRFIESRLKLREAAHRCASLVHASKNAQELTKNVKASCQRCFIGRVPVNPCCWGHRQLANHCIRTNFCMDPNFPVQLHRRNTCQAIYKIRTRFFDLPGRFHINGCIIDNMSRTGSIFRRERFWRCSIRGLFGDPSQIQRC